MTTVISHDDPRVRLAAERTLLAWIRTGLAMMGFGFVVARFGFFLRTMSGANVDAGIHESILFSHWMGTALVGFGTIVTVASGWQHFSLLKIVSPDARGGVLQRYLGIAVAAVLSGFGATLVTYLVRSSWKA